jgi:hypothetical protein
VAKATDKAGGEEEDVVGKRRVLCTTSTAPLAVAPSPADVEQP